MILINYKRLKQKVMVCKDFNCKISASLSDKNESNYIFTY